ncbi:hypothetical protein P7K49_026580 [Saguinus oedipus]|uniref:C3H1-type domain-containing protein n=1 Tax=Saguinus oedipus TaxID=9490 RepID=A0ABQ9UDM6_SAGOE|nr:hypothetical protein P7K49_026580 [Saguinus oedipus]
MSILGRSWGSEVEREVTTPNPGPARQPRDSSVSLAGSRWRRAVTGSRAGWTLQAAVAVPWPGTSFRPGSGWAPCLPSGSRPSLPICSRAVQRSLAIIRQARQRREKRKEFCMYYNRFGRCNRGERCPYIHDPEKVAVCTRCPPALTVGPREVLSRPCSQSLPAPPHTLLSWCCRFVRGTCKKTDGTCPFSHHVSKEKVSVALAALLPVTFLWDLGRPAPG